MEYSNFEPSARIWKNHFGYNVIQNSFALLFEKKKKNVFTSVYFVLFGFLREVSLIFQIGLGTEN